MAHPKRSAGNAHAATYLHFDFMMKTPRRHANSSGAAIHKDKRRGADFSSGTSCRGELMEVATD
jgi:hypothetical protein